MSGNVKFPPLYTLSVLLLLLGCAQGSNPKVAENHLQKGFRFADDHEWAKALGAFHKATVADPASTLAWANHGTALLNLGRPREAIKSYMRARELNPKDPYVYCSLGSACQALGQFEEALIHLDQALLADPLFAPAMANKAKALSHLGQEEEAKILYERAFKLDPTLRSHFR